MGFTVSVKSHSSCKWWRCCFVLLLFLFYILKKKKNHCLIQENWSEKWSEIKMLFLCWVWGIPALYDSGRALNGEANNMFSVRPVMVMSISSSVSLESRGAEPWYAHALCKCPTSHVSCVVPEPRAALHQPLLSLTCIKYIWEKSSLVTVFAMLQMKLNGIFRFFILARK